MTLRLGRRSRHVLLAVASVAAMTAALGGVAQAEQPKTVNLTVLGTSDTHGNVFNWDYYLDSVYGAGGNNVGLAKVSTLVKNVRQEVGADHTVLIDSGDTIQGTPLTTYYAKQEPITTTGEIHPMARAMDLMGYDSATLGNHEFNYGLPLLDKWIGQLNFPALAANAIDVTTGQPAYKPFTIRTMAGDSREHPVHVGILGLTNPGVAIWDKGNVEGKLRFDDMVTTAQKWVPIMKRAGADVIVVAAHGGDSGTSSYGPDLPIENPAKLIAKQVPDIDAILFGHAHSNIPQEIVNNTTTGHPVLMAEPSKWGQRVTRMDFKLVRHGERWSVLIDPDPADPDNPHSTNLNTNTVAEDPVVDAAVQKQHDTTVTYVNQVVAHSTEAMTSAESRYRDTPIIDYINQVQTDTVAAAMKGTPNANLPVLSIAAPFSRDSSFPAGDVKIKDVAGLYIYDNTLEAVVMNAAEVKAYLEWSAKYFKTFGVGDPVDPLHINDDAVPDYNYDTISGLDYDIDISRPVGQRITKLTYPGTDTVVPADAQFVVAVNNYRRSGGGNFPGIVKPQVYNQGQEIRQLLIDWAKVKGVIDPKDFYHQNWQLVREGQPVF